MGNTLIFKPKLAMLERKRVKLLEKEQAMDNNCDLQEWFKVRNEIRKVTSEILELKNAQRYS